MAPVLRHLEDRIDLPAWCAPHKRIAVNRDGEATFSIDETHDPLRMQSSGRASGFLLIVPTGRIFTAHPASLSLGCDSPAWDERVPPDTGMFQHIARFTHGQWYELTVIVTAAVYWRLVSGLRLTANPST